MPTATKVYPQYKNHFSKPGYRFTQALTQKHSVTQPFWILITLSRSCQNNTDSVWYNKNKVPGEKRVLLD